MKAEEFLTADAAPTAEDFLGGSDAESFLDAPEPGQPRNLLSQGQYDRLIAENIQQPAAPVSAPQSSREDVMGVFGGNRPQPYGEAREILSSPIATATAPFAVVGRPLNAALQDVGATIAGAPEFGGNLYKLATRDEPVFSSAPLPYQETLAEISKSNPAIATAGKFAAGLVESSPMLAVMPQGALGKMIAAGFTVDMLNQGGEAASLLGEEMGKPPGDRNYDKITTALSGLASSAAFAPLTGAHAGGRVIGERVAPRAEVIRELAIQLKSEPINPRVAAIKPQRELGLPPVTAEAFLQPGVPELADAALRESRQIIQTPESGSALQALREAVEPTQIEPATVAAKPDVAGGKISFAAEAGGIPNARQAAVKPVAAEVAPTPKAEPSAIEQSAADTGWTAGERQIGGIKLDTLPPETLAALKEKMPVQVEFTDRRAGSPSEGFTVYAPENSTAAEIRSLIEKKSAEAANPSEPAATPPDVKPAEIPPTPAEPAPAAAANQGILDTAISNIESLQKRIRGTGSDLNMGVPTAILDTALEVARVALKAGKSVKEAVDAAVSHIRANFKGEFREMEARRTLMAEMERQPAAAASAPTAGATPAPTPSRPTPGTPAPPAPTPRPPTGTPAPGATLADIYKIFEPKPKSPFNPKKTAVNVIEAVRTGLSSKFRPINKLAEDIAKSYGLTRPKDIAGIFEQLKGSQGKGEADVYRFDRDVSSLVKGNEKDFNPYMFLRRTLDRLNQDAADVAAGLPARRSVSAYTTPEIQAKLALLESNLGPEVVSKFQQAADRYQTYMDNALKLQVESGRMSQEVYDAIKSGNQFYAPFKVMKYLEQTSRPEGVGSKVDTMAEFTKAMKGIEDADFRLGDMLGAARQSILISRILADKNMAMRHVAELAPFDTSGLFIKRIPAGADAPAGMEIVNVLENGKQKRYAVNPDVAQALQIYGGTAGGVISRMLGAISVPFRAGATAFNLPFQVSNLLADVPRLAIMSKYGIKNPIDLIHYPLEWAQSVLASVGKDVFGIDSKLMQDFLDSGVAGGTVQEFLTPEALQFREPTSISKSRKLGESVLYSIPRFAAAIEQSTKVLGVKRAVRFEGVQGGKELAKQLPQAITELRRYSGSPDFGRQGKWTETMRLNLLYMFLNARIQGLTADVSRLAGMHGGKTTAATWFRLASAVGIPSAYLYFLNQRPENKEDYDKRPLQERLNYWLIPKDDENGKPRYITTEDGEKIRDYWRIPKRESSKWMANYTEAALNFAQKRDPKAALEFGNSMLQEISPVNIQGENATEKLESMASGLNPLIKAPLELATGRDLYRHRDIMSDQLKKASPELQFNERTAEAFKVIAEKMPDVAPEFLRSPIIVENLTRNLTAGLLTQFLPRKPIAGRSSVENTPLLQRFQSLPYTDQQAFKEQMAQLERNAADEQLVRHRAAVKLLEDNKDKPLEEYAAKAGDERTLKTLIDLYVAKQNGATFQDRQVLSLPARQRAMYVLHKLEGLTPDQKNQMILDMARKRILTEAVLEEIATQLKK